MNAYPVKPVMVCKHFFSLRFSLLYLGEDWSEGAGVRRGVETTANDVRQGSVAVFPHGEARDALLHEGTGVVEGAKYVIRTDVEYDVEAGLA